MSSLDLDKTGGSKGTRHFLKTGCVCPYSKEVLGSDIGTFTATRVVTTERFDPRKCSASFSFPTIDILYTRRCVAGVDLRKCDTYLPSTKIYIFKLCSIPNCFFWKKKWKGRTLLVFVCWTKASKISLKGPKKTENTQNCDYLFAFVCFFMCELYKFMIVFIYISNYHVSWSLMSTRYTEIAISRFFGLFMFSVLSGMIIRLSYVNIRCIPFHLF